MPHLQVFAPADGKLVPLEQVPDPAFSERMLGDGVAVAPSSGFVCAPFDGKVTSVHKALHAVAVAAGGAEALIHVGVETVNLQGRGFKALVQPGDEVKKGQKLTEFDPDFLAQNAPSNLVILVITSPDGAPLSKTNLSAVRAGQDPVFSVTLDEAAGFGPAAAPQDWVYSRPVVIANANGLHARPAGKLAEAAKRFSFPLEIEQNGQTADAKSLVSVMGMALARASQVRLRAPQNAPGAPEALEQLAALLESGLGEADAQPAPAPAPKLCSSSAQMDFSGPAALKALTACPGVARGKTWLYAAPELDFEETASDPAAEQDRLGKALIEAEREFERETASAPNKAAREILQAHASLLKDPFLAKQAAGHIRLGKSAPAAFNEAIRASIDVLKKTKNRFLMERIADFKDLRKRVLLKLTGAAQKTPDFPDGCIVIAKELLPSDLAMFDSRVRGALLAQGSPTAHASILLRNMGLPALVGAGECVLSVPDGTDAALNATEGVIYIHPTERQTQRLAQLQAEEKTARERNQKAAQEPALTKDGARVWVCGNASTEREAVAAFENGADGLGLVRTEFLFYQSQEAPAQERQFMLYQNIAAALHGRPVTLRAFDVGGDKPVPYMPLPAEDNPIVGLRGVRNYGQYRDLFLSQIRAMLRVRPAGAVRIMLPMIAFVEELVEYKKIIEEEKMALGVSAPVEVGIMVEVPSAALMAEQFAKHADFFSLGTNDLTQYTLAIDRGHKTLCARADHLNPAVLDLIALTCQGAAKYKRPTAVCGAMAGDLQAVPLLIGLGVTELAVGAGAVAQIKALVRTLDLTHCRRIAAQARTLDNTAQVRDLAQKEFGV